MKITKFGDGIPVALDGWSTGYQSIGSNTDSNPPLSALNFVQRITSNTSNTLLNPIVNFAAGSNIALSASSNTLTITGLGGSSSGASGSTTITTKDEGSTLSTAVTTLDFVGTGVTASGAGATTTVTISSGGGGITQAYVGYNTIGGTFETTAANGTWYLKSVTLANDCLMTSIDGYFTHTAGTGAGPASGVFSNSGSNHPLMFLGGSPNNEMLLKLDANGARWISAPCGMWLTAGTYWIGLRTTDLGISATVAMQIAYDVGTDETKVQGLGQALDIVTATVTARKYSIRANTIR